MFLSRSELNCRGWTVIVEAEALTQDVDPWIGRVIDQRYRVDAPLGRGAMGVVYKVTHIRMGKIAALKLLDESVVADPAMLSRFRREAESISKLNHPNIVQTFDFGNTGNTVYLVMEYLKGQDLQYILSRDERLPLRQTASILAQTCDALTEAHALHIVHRDLKPANLRVARTRDGQDFVKVLDFGLAKLIGEDASPGETGEGHIVGTPYYMAPEQIRAEDVDGRCDLYALGAIAYRMITGVNPFDAKTPMGVLTKHITEDIIPPSEYLSGTAEYNALDEFILRAMAKDRAYRFQSAESMKEALYALVSSASGEVILTPRDSIPANLVSADLRRRRTDFESRSQSGATQPELRFSSVDVERTDPGLLETKPITPPVELEESDELLLAREDVALDKVVKRRKLPLLSATLLVLAAVGVAAYFVVGQKDTTPTVSTVEVEPNNEISQAALLPSGNSVRGTLGKRLSREESDRDWYRLEIKGDGKQILRAELEPIRNMNLILALYDHKGAAIVKANSAGVGSGEVISNWPLNPGTYYLVVREFWLAGSDPTENVTDEYRIKAEWAPLTSGWELEPNDTTNRANTIKAGQTIEGYLGAADDVDVYRFKPAKRYLYAELSPVSDVDVVLTVKEDKRRPKVVDKGKASAGERLTKFKLKDDSEIFITVSRTRATKDKDLPAKGLTSPYRLRVWEMD